MPILVRPLFEKLRKRGWMVTTAESCTGGLIAGAITEVSGSSAFFDRGFVTYSNTAKMQMLGVSAKTLSKYGAVSAHTAKEMAEGALDRSDAQIAVSVTGIAGPDGGSIEKPVGLVYIGIATESETTAHQFTFTGNRTSVREQTVEKAFSLLMEALS